MELLESLLESLNDKIDLQNEILCRVHKKKLPTYIINRVNPDIVYDSQRYEENE
ncbi:MAG: hypothetical protein IK038_03310 [Bacteroidaceae bacterium]|nr:hypothetical protein [Bacteroidaceae bacterium]